MTIKETVLTNNLQHLFVKGSFGIEKEGLRTDLKGNLALTPHPEAFGNRKHHPYIQTDFSESQLELVTPPHETLQEQYQWLKALHDVVNRTLDKDEFVWPFSMPNRLPKEEAIPIIDVSDKSEIEYREQLASKYGKKKQMISGVHFNFSFTEEFIEALAQDHLTEEETADLCNEMYLKMSRNFLRYQWLLTYLFGASPVSDDTYSAEESNTYFRSIRNSPLGYHNTFSNKVSYQSIRQYAEDIETLVDDKTLIEEREYYGASRLRGKGKMVRDLISKGTRYVEFRSFDINPLDSLGFSYEQSQFTHLFLLTMIWMERDHSDKEIEEGAQMNKATALENPFEPSQFKKEGIEILNLMSETASELKMEDSYHQVIEKAESLLENPEQTLSAKIVTELKKGKSHIQYGIELGQQYKQTSFEKPFLLNGFQEMEMSTQLLLFDALKMGVETSVLDYNDQFLKLSYTNKVEYVRNGNMTSKDTYISHWIMANKTVTKKVLKNAGYQVPGGEEFTSEQQALDHFVLFRDKPIVIKPKSTNYGIGISIFKKPASLDGYTEAVRLAFQEDAQILVEEYIEGTEYRFFVINDKVEAVLLRQPANVIGNGSDTIEELISEKNKHPYRGVKHRAPLEKIKMGEIEQLMLKEQGYSFDSILEKGKQVFLRENSNISTGGDSIDMTDEMHDSYKQIAVDMAKALEVKVTGLDLIVPDINKPSASDHPGYVVIEANFNPAMHMHAFVQKGSGRNLSEKVITMLYPSIELS
ncbi:MAG: bifunctional glutamate--cysteine ligase GshA/glutathione synthetase GshB [Alkalibacterium sp.]|nr:bifunctional glutamate--cysteine ligase GshA/glutathione synthetase GshB [Alkalibacterium sp.]